MELSVISVMGRRVISVMEHGNFGDGTQRNFGDGTQGNFQWKNVSTEFESMAFSQLNEICLEVFVYNDLKCAQF